MRHLPTYVYLVFCALVYIGAKRCLARDVPPARPLLFPAVFVGLGLLSLGHLFPHSGAGAYAVALAAVALGTAVGWHHARRWRLQFRNGAHGWRVRLPGDASLLVTLLLTFAAETFIHYAIAAGRPWAATASFGMAAFATWGLLVGMPLGRAINVVTRSICHVNGAPDAAAALP
ncbi:hypothetical protein G3N57_26860 [Paraburkholderia sp. Se-20369]|nr:hypothetical protein [Paraburkholderia sp. Se-20369]